ncbi:uncharacterized protein LOC135142169 [Zophobas morio]|uniref:uncharacterized protein LOC135142169 n=1 Tax=Zophobas morio TaxID=2755281 RepID=UPI0030832DB7
MCIVYSSTTSTSFACETYNKKNQRKMAQGLTPPGKHPTTVYVRGLKVYKQPPFIVLSLCPSFPSCEVGQVLQWTDLLHALISIFFISGSGFATAGPSKKRSFDCVSPAETQEERPPKRRPGIDPQSIHPQPPRSPSPIIPPFIVPYFITNPVDNIPIPHIPTPAHLDPPRRFRPRVPAHSRAVKTLLPLFIAQAPSSQKTVPPGTELPPLPDMDDGLKPLSEYQAFCVWRAQWERQYYQERRLTHRTLDAALFLHSYCLSLDGGFRLV